MPDDTTKTVEPEKGFISDLWRLAFILLLTLAVRTWVVSHAIVTSRDSLGFIRYALQLEDPPQDPANPSRKMTRVEVIQRAEHPPGYYASVLLVSYPMRAIMGGTTCDSMVLSTQVASVLAALLLTFPMYYLGRRLFDRQTAFVATLLFQCLPVWTAITSDGLSDGLFTLMAVSTLWCGVRSYCEPTAGRFVLTGIATGLAYLVRPEGMLLLAACGSVAVGCIVFRRWNWRPGLLRISGLVAGALLIGLPYIVLIGKLTNKPSGDILTNRMMGKDSTPSWGVSDRTAPPGVTILLADWFSEMYNQGETREVWALKGVSKQILKTLHYVAPFTALLGLFVLRRRIREETALLYLVVQLGIYLAALVMLAIMVGYISERHTLVVALIGCYLTAAALPVCGKWLTSIAIVGRRVSPQTAAAALGFCLILLAIPGDFKRLHANRLGHHAAGMWLAKNAQPDEYIFDIFAWAEFYTGRTLRQLPDRFGWVAEHKPVYTILEPHNLNPHSRLTYLQEAKNIAAQGQPVYFWPEGNPEKATVIVYRFDAFTK